MSFETVTAQAQPFLYVTRSATMEPGDIPRASMDGFTIVGGYIRDHGITPCGPAIAVYRDWDGQTMKIDLGFPFGIADVSQAGGDVKAGQTPDGTALKTVHHGAYSALQKTYDRMEQHIADAGLKPTGIAWEVYVSDPAETAEADLVTEVYMQLA